MSIEQNLYDRVTTARPWRWTLGRASCLFRIPIYILFTSFQIMKCSIKFTLALLTLNQLGKFTSTRSWTFSGLGKDGIMVMSTLQCAVNSIWCVVWAPPKQYRDMQEVLSTSMDMVFVGSYARDPQLKSVTDVARLAIATTPHYGKMIRESSEIHTEFAAGLLKKQQNVPVIKAG